MDFVRECMAWGEEAFPLTDQIARVFNPPELDEPLQCTGRFHYNDLTAVMAAFRAHLKTHPGWLWSIERCPDTDYVLVTIVYGDDSSGRAEIFNENMCHALMEACIEAQRKVARAA